MSLLSICQWLQDTPWGTGIRESIWVFPIIETVHVLALGLSVGMIAVVDLRLIGVALRRQTVSNVVQQIEPWAAGGFVVMFSSGALLFLSEAARCYSSWYFRVKLLFLLLTGLNVLAFHLTVYRGVAKWNDSAVTPARAKLVGWTSLALWMGVIAAGRATAYTVH
jgi:hypothetical protein